MTENNIQSARRNQSIDMFRYLCAVLVVVIHTSPFDGTGFGTFLREYAAKIAVPFFLVVSGYFYFIKLDSNGKALRRFLKHIVPLYFIWSIPYWLLNLYVLHDEPGFSLSGYALRCVMEFFTRGSYYHFWFFPALIYSAMVSTFLWKQCSETVFLLVSVLLMALGCWFTSYRFVSPAFSELIGKYCGENGTYCFQRIVLTGMPYFMLGGVISRRKDKWTAAITGTDRKEWIVLLVICALYTLEKILLTHFGSTDLVLTVMLYPLVGAILIVLLRHPLPECDRIGLIARSAANVVYYVHPLLIVIVQKVFELLIGQEADNTILFLIVWAVASGMGYLLSKRKHAKK